MWVFGIGVNLKLLRHRLAEFGLRQHALDGKFDDALGALSNHLTGCSFAKAARVTRVVAINLLLSFIPLQYSFTCVNHDDVITSIQKGSPLRATLAGQY